MVCSKQCMFASEATCESVLIEKRPHHQMGARGNIN